MKSGRIERKKEKAKAAKPQSRKGREFKSAKRMLARLSRSRPSLRPCGPYP